MDKNKAIDLIKAKSLDCLTKAEDTELKEYMESGDDFPWDVLGEYQNLSAMLPLLLQVEMPESELKDNVARKLYKILEELKAKQQAEITPESETKALESEPEIISEPTDEKSLPEETVKFSLGGKNPPKEEEITTEPVDEITDLKITEHEVENKISPGKTEEIIDEKLERQKTIEYVKSYFKEEMNDIKDANKKNKLFSIILFAVLLVLLVVVYFLLSSDISSNKEQIDKLGFNEPNIILQDDSLV